MYFRAHESDMYNPKVCAQGGNALVSQNKLSQNKVSKQNLAKHATVILGIEVTDE